MAVPNIFANVTTSIPLSQLDNNFATPITLGNASLYLGNTITSVGNLTLTNVTISSGNITGTTITLANGSVTNAMLANSTATLGNTTITLGSTTSNVGNLTLTNATVNSLSAPLAESSGGTGTTTGYYGFKNRIINGAMVIDQRNAGASVTGTASLVYNLDRYASLVNTDGVMTFQRVADAPTGFQYSLKATATTADASLSATQRAILLQRIEGFNAADFMLGSANAVQFTLSFWVKSTLTGTFGGAFQNNDSSRAYPFTYSISAANTWEQKTVTITGDTTGTWNTTTGTGLQVCWGLGVGTTYSATAGSWQAGDFNSATGGVSVIGTLNATWQVTGVQLEKGSTATSFDYRPYGTELQLCQRYCEKLPTGGYGAVGVRTTDWYGYIGWQTEKRANATVTLSGTVNIVGSVGDINTQTPTGIDQISTKTARLYRTGSSFTSQAGTFYVSDSILVTAEL